MWVYSHSMMRTSQLPGCLTPFSNSEDLTNHFPAPDYHLWIWLPARGAAFYGSEEQTQKLYWAAHYSTFLKNLLIQLLIISAHYLFDLTWIMSFHDVWVPNKRAITLNMQTLCKRRKSSIILCICIYFITMCYIHFISWVLFVDLYIYTQLEKIIRIGYLPCHNPDSYMEMLMLTELKKLLKKRYWFKIIIQDDLSKINDIYWENGLHVSCIAPDLLASP